MSNMGQSAVASAEAYYDKYGIPRVPLSEALKQIEISIKFNQTRGVWCLISEAGEGKSQGIHQLAKRYGKRVVDIRTSQFSLMGAGVPQRADESGHFKIAVPEFLPRKGEGAILLFDEINQGQPHALAMFFQMLEDRCMFDYELPDDCVIVSLMNPSTAGYSVTKLETNAAFNRRLLKLYVYNTFNDWKKHAQTKEFHYTDGMEKPCHPMIVKLLTATPAMLYTAKDRDGNKQYACPATWQTVSLSLYNLEKAGVALTSEFAEARVAASINTVNARTLIEYIRNNEVLVGPAEVLQHYKQKSKIRKRVLEMNDEAGGEPQRLAEDVANYIFREKPPVPEIIEQFVLYWSDMRIENKQSFYQVLNAASNANGGSGSPENIGYMKSLTKAGSAIPAWMELNAQINSVHDTFERDMKGKGKIPDPMK